MSDNFDWSEALRAVKGDPTLLKVIMQTFLEETPHLVERIRTAIARGDGPALKIAAHSLKGSFRYLGIAPAFEQAFRLEKMGQEGNLANCQEVLEDLQGQITQIVPAVSQYLQHGDAGTAG